MRLAIPFLSAGLALAIAGPALAATYYVSPSGSGGGSTNRNAPGKASSTVQASKSGDVVVFLDGTYNSDSMYFKSGGVTLRADDGAVPVIRGPGTGNGSGLAADASGISNLVIEGLWFENWGSGGVEIDWQAGVTNLTIRNCVSDSNGRNGFSPYRSTNVTIEYNIASRNGWGPSSWSSNFNIYNVKGNNNVVRGNVAFHGIDTSSGQSDGNGFILDVTINQGSALFENNIAFMNGGSCISITDSGGARLVGNTCYSNSQQAASYMDEINMGNTCRGNVDGVPVNQGSYTFSGLELRNNALIPTKAGKDGINVYNTSPCGPSTSYTDQGNHIMLNGGSLFVNAGAADFRPLAGSALVDQVAHGSTFATDIGFDSKCVKVETDNAKKRGYSWWTFAPDLAYMKTIGGIKNCWAPRMRPQGSNQEIGAYEHVASAGCSSAAECNDNNACTTDTCNGSGQCINGAIAACCQSATECDDGNPCTADACNSSACSQSPISGCCQSNTDCTSPSACLTATCDTTAGSCVTTAVPNCCSVATDCNDGNSCTQDMCNAQTGACGIALIPWCCQFDGDCVDDDACTADVCSPDTQRCTHTPGACTPGGSGGSAGSVATGGAAGSGGSTAEGGVSSGGAPGGGVGPGGSGMATPGPNTQFDPGCACSVPARDSRTAHALGLLAIFGLLAARRSRR